MPQKNKKSAAKGRGKDTRVAIPEEVADVVLKKCRRVCCMCYGLEGDRHKKKGQLAHLKRHAKTKVSEEDVAFLCLECHAEYDNKDNRTRAYTPNEIRHYQDLLYKELGCNQVTWQVVVSCNSRRAKEVRKAVLAAIDQISIVASDTRYTETPRGF